MTYMAYHDIIAKYEASHPGAFRFETRDFPLESECGFGGIHGSACEAAVAVRLARAKNKGAELEAWLFERQESMSRDLVKEGLAADRPGDQLRRGSIRKLLEQVRADARLGQQLGVQGTPTFFVNGIRVGSLRPAYFDAAIAYLLSKVVRTADKAAGRAAAARGYGRDSDGTAHQALPDRVLASAPLRRAAPADPVGRTGRGVRLPGPERRRQDHHAEAADAAGVSHRRHRPRSWAGRSATPPPSAGSAICRRTPTSTTT